MELQFKFKNDVIFSVDIAAKKTYAYSYIGYRETSSHFAIDYESDDDLIELMKRASNIVNSEQHREVFEIIFDYYKDGKIKCEDDGSLDICVAFGMVPAIDEMFISQLELYGYTYEFDYDNQYSYIRLNDKSIASINYLPQFNYEND